MPSFPPFQSYAAFCRGLCDSERHRQLRPLHLSDGARAAKAGRQLINFSSNNYLGLAQHPALAREAAAYAARWGTGAGSSRLVTGTLVAHEALEEKIAAAKGAEAALVFASGYQANVSVLEALFDKQVLGASPLVFSDRLNHASMHLGCRAAGVRQLRYGHGDLDHLETLLAKYENDPRPKFILSETVFSMDGDRADLPGLMTLANKSGAVLYLDEAHATGVMGPGGHGLAAGAFAPNMVVMGTFSKALGSFGAYVAGSAVLRDYLINRAGGFIYATAVAPPLLGAMTAAWEMLPALEEARETLAERAAAVRARFQSAGFDTGASSSQIIPVILGEDGAALAMSRDLEEAGLLVAAIRPPTVPVGASRLRFSLTAAHTAADIAFLCDTMASLAEKRVQGPRPLPPR